MGAQMALHVVVRGVDEGWYALRQATFAGVQQEEWQHMNVRCRELRQELRVAGFFDRKSQSERHVEAGIEETAEAGQRVREELREEQLVAKSFAPSVLVRVPRGAVGEVPSLTDVLGADRHG